MGRSEAPFLEGLAPRRKVVYATRHGEAWQGDSARLLKKLQPGTVDLIFTSPPYALLKKKSYGNESAENYVRWFRPFARIFHTLLKDTGSLVLNLGNAWEKGQPTRSLYPYRLLLDLCDPPRARRGAKRFHLAQEFFWLNPAKIPNPAQWVTIERIRVKDAVEPIWWLSKTPRPKADNRKVLVPYSARMGKLLETQRYNAGIRPSGWNISDVWGRNNGGAIRPNFDSGDGLDMIFNVLVEANTSSTDSLRTALRDRGSKAHPAMFPRSLPEIFIRMLTDEGDVVVDPFCGSNTTGHVADTLGRTWLSIDIDSAHLTESSLRWAEQPPARDSKELGSADRSQTVLPLIQA